MMPRKLSGVENIKSFYSGGKVFVTGATGFLGKVLIESLLRKTGVEKIYVLIKSKKNKSAEERLKELIKSNIFTNLRNDAPDRLSAIFPMIGDIEQPNMGLSEKDRHRIIEEVDVIFHVAAIVAFNGNLKVAIDVNVRGTRAIMELARNVKKLKAIMHISTAYSNSHLREIEERIYPLNDRLKIVKIPESIDVETVKMINSMAIKESANTYIFTKRLAEYLIGQDYKDLPVGIVRPGVVIGALEEPLPGWLDNLHGPTGLAIGLMMGVIHSVVIRHNARADLVPVDFVINCLISAAWDTYSKFTNDRSECTDIPVYNVVSSPQSPITWGQFHNHIIQEGRIGPPKGSVWFPFSISTSSWTIFRLMTLIFHYFPAIVADSIRIFSGSRAKWVKMYQQTDHVMAVLIPFSTREWKFSNENVDVLWSKLSNEEKELFPFSFREFDWTRCLSIYFKGIKKYMIEGKSDENGRKQRGKRLFVIHYSLVTSMAIVGLGTLHYYFL